MNREITFFQAELELPFGSGESEEQSSCLFRPFRRLLDTGANPGFVNYIFYRHVDDSVYNLGSICLTETNMVLYFPGLLQQEMLWEITKRGKYLKVDAGGTIVDHITLVSDLKKSHFTVVDKISPGKKHKLKSFSTIQVSKDQYFWFGLSIQDPRVLEPTAFHASVSFPTPETDADRRLNEFMKAREGAIWHIVEQADVKPFRRDEFIHFNFFISPKNEKIPNPYALFSLPTKPPIVSGYDDPERIPCRSHEVMLPSFNMAISLHVSRHGGVLHNEAIMGVYLG